MSINEGMQFDEATVRTLESLYQTQEAATRRRTVLDALKLRLGECILDIGTGPGFLALEMAGAVGATGQVECIDESEQMIDVALKRCGGKPWVCFRIGSATDLAVTSNSCDAVASVQVYEFVTDIEKALAELHRVLRPGGRAAIVSTDWPSTAWNSSDPKRMDRILDAFSEHCAHIALPRFISPMIKAAGFTISKLSVLPQFSVTYGPDRFGFQMAGLISSFVPGRRGVTQEEAAAWLDGLKQIGERGDWFFNVNQYLFLLEKPA